MSHYDIEMVIPYGRSKTQCHLRFNGDYKTFCGIICEGWPTSDQTVSQSLDSVYTCKRCLKSFWS